MNKTRPGLRPLSFILATALMAFAGCATRATAIVGATVIPADGSSPLPAATVLVEGGRIAAVGHDVHIPPGTKIIDAQGKFLIPGLWEMHIHLSKTRPSAMKLLVANGITNVRDMGGDIEELMRWRDEVSKGDRIGPEILTAGPYLESPANVERMLAKPVADNVEPVERTRIGVRDPEHARQVVRSLAGQGVDFIKVREVADDATFVAIGLSARDEGLKLMAHPMGVALDKLVESRIGSIEHFFVPFLDETPVSERRRFFKDLADLGTAFVPNLYLFTVSEQTPNDEIRAFLNDESNVIDRRRKYLSRYLLKDWQEQLEQDRTADRKEFFRKLMPSLLRDVREMRQAGIRILPGTDTAVVFVFPGWALHEELALYVDLLGFTPLEAIEAATRQSAELMGVAGDFGTIEPGKVANLILLDGNPLSNIRNTRKIDSVILRGRHFNRSSLDQLLESVTTDPDVIEDSWGRYPEAANTE